MVDDTEQRAREWIRKLSECAARLREVEERLSTVNHICELGAIDYARMTTRILNADADKVGRLLEKREQIRGELEEERDMLAAALTNGKRLIVEAWKASGGKSEGAARFVLSMCAHGLTPPQAGRALGVKRAAANYNLHAVARLLVAYDGARFAVDKPPYGYEEFARGADGKTCQ